MAPPASRTHEHDRPHVGWVVDDDDTYRQQAALLLAEGEDLGQKTAVFGPRESAALAELRPMAAMAADPYADVLARGPLEPARMLAMFREQSALARAEGHAGLRVVADMDWLLPAAPSTADVVAFELLLDRVVEEVDATVLCAYRRGSFDERAIEGMLCVHPRCTGHGEEPPFRLVAGDGAWELSGEVDAMALEPLVAALGAAAADDDRCVVDVAALEFIDVAGMRAIAQTARSRPARLELRGTRRSLRRYWSLARLDELAPSVTLA
jgi:ABC-type transporter Mla MlaB component